MAEPIRILHVLGNTQLGGAESRTMDLYRHMDRSRIQFDFLVHTGESGHFDKEIEELGGRIYRVPRFRLYNYFSYRKAVRRFFEKHHEFRVVQGHITSTASIYLPLAKKAGVPVTVAHARSAGVDRGMKGKLTRMLRRSLSDKTDYMFTCSRLAGISVFGEKAVREGKTVFIPNAIDCERFAYDPAVRERMRRTLGVEGRFVVGHVGRFHYAKNHEFLLQIFARLCGKKDNCVLLLLGEGAGMEAAREQAKQLRIEDKVFFLGNHSNIYDYYQAMDYFVYPSRFEGLPGTIVEAQCSGLPCLMSDTICQEVAVTELVRTMSIAGRKQGEWAEYIMSTAEYERTSHAGEMKQAGFDVNTQAGIMTEFYESGEWK